MFSFPLGERQVSRIQEELGKRRDRSTLSVREV